MTSALHLPSADDYLPGHGDPAWSARHYDLTLSYDLVGNRLRGEAVIDAVVLVATKRLVLDLAHLGVDKVTVDGRPPARWAARGHRVVLTLGAVAEEGTELRVVLKYSGQPRPLVEKLHGDAGWEELEDGVIVAGQPHGAPTWFPCNDRPDDKASYRLVVSTHPDYVVVANGTCTGRQRRGSAVTWTYEQAEPMATYLATVQIGRYDVRELESDVPMTVAVPQGTDTADPGFDATFGRQPEMMAAFVERFGPYPFPSYAVVVTDDELEIPLESQSLSTFGSNFLVDDWDSERLVAHELAHQWFGNTVTLGDWRDIWLHEGFACYSEWLWSEASGRDSADEWARHHHARLADLPQDLLLADPGPEDMFDDRVYKRGALTLHAVRLTVGDDAFFSLLRAWVAEHSGGNVSTDQFVAFANEHTGVGLAELLTSWLRHLELPELPAG